ncbi:Conserved_hypothetical protein [Hexamita inflata]|uniref:Uncharacterized protein n=1 Tax=Hexamita inflata TaxID=28002 RepID=A0ABP1HDM3_9EUKA
MTQTLSYRNDAFIISEQNERYKERPPISQEQFSVIMIEICKKQIVDYSLTINNNQVLESIEFVNLLNIKKLKLYDCRNVIPGLSNNQIKDLTIIACNLESLNRIQLNSLEVLTLGDYQSYSKLSLQNIVNYSKLRELHMVGYTIDVAPLLQMEQVSVLDIKDCYIINTQLISFLKSLEELVITDCMHKISSKTYNSQNIVTFQNLTRLKRLNLSQNSLQTQDPLLNNIKFQISSIKSCSKLNQVRIYGYHEDLSTIQYLRQLEVLELNSCNLSNIDFLRPLQNLQELYLNDNQIVYVNAVEQLQKVTRLNICNNIVVYTKFYNIRFNLLNIGFQKQPTKQQLKQANIQRDINSPTLLLNSMKIQRRNITKKISIIKQKENVLLRKFTYNQISFTSKVVQLFQMMTNDNDY